MPRLTSRGNWRSSPRGCAVHDITAARIHALPALYRAAVVTAPGDIASHEFSRAQAKLLLQALGASDEQRALIDAAFR